MFPHTITIYRHSIENNQDVYSKQVIKGFYAVVNKTLSADQKGVESTKPSVIISNPENARKYGVEWTVQGKDRIIIGVGGDITSFNDIPEAIKVTGIEANVIGSDVDNVTITGA